MKYRSVQRYQNDEFHLINKNLLETHPNSSQEGMFLSFPRGDDQRAVHSGKTCIVIAGPTAVGKTAISIKIAEAFSTQIISADSRQCFRELTIGVAKPSPKQLQTVRHHFIDSHSIHQPVTAAMFEQYALTAANEAFKRHELVIMTGGTGLYINAFCGGLDEIPVVREEIRQEIRAGYTLHGIGWLQEQVKICDPRYFIEGEIQNPHRLIRALEVKQSTGRSIRSYQKQPKKQRDFNVLKIGLRLCKEDLHRNINHRVNEMAEQGLVEEVNRLVPFRHLNALNTVGYTELFDYFDGKKTLDQAIEAIKLHTRHYAKRQMTWFARDEAIRWFDPNHVSAIKAYICESAATLF